MQLAEAPIVPNPTDSRPCAEHPTYVALNKSLFEDQDAWKYKDLQKLAATLGQKGNGKRDDIVERLQKWHLKDPDFDSDASDKSDDEDANDENQAFNENGSPTAAPVQAKRNFHLLEVQLRETKANERLLSPLKVKCKSATPRSILRKKSSFHGPPVDSAKKEDAKGIVFSPFNGVKLIPHRHNLEQHSSPDDEESNTNFKQQLKFGYEDDATSGYADDGASGEEYYDCMENYVEPTTANTQPSHQSQNVNQHIRF